MQLVPLFKKTKSKRLYWQAWLALPTKVVIHEGDFGTKGHKTELSHIPGKPPTPQQTIERESFLTLQQGYHPALPSALIRLVFNSSAVLDEEHEDRLFDKVFRALRDTANCCEIHDELLDDRWTIDCSVVDFSFAVETLKQEVFRLPECHTVRMFSKRSGEQMYTPLPLDASDFEPEQLPSPVAMPVCLATTNEDHNFLLGLHWGFNNPEFDMVGTFKQAVDSAQPGPLVCTGWEEPERPIITDNKVRISYPVSRDGVTRFDNIQLESSSDQGFSALELLYKIHNALCATLRSDAHFYFEGLEFDRRDQHLPHPTLILKLGS